MYEGLQQLMAPDLDNPGLYWKRIAALLNVYIGNIRSHHRHCDVTGCRTCAALTDAVSLALAHNRLQTFNEVTEEYEPYPLLDSITGFLGPFDSDDEDIA
jgi:hypothetical protein